VTFEEGLRLALGGAEPPSLPADTYEKLAVLDRLLCHWAVKLDLVGFKTEEQRRLRYFAEPLAASSWLPLSGTALDIGSGGGSPALPFAIVRPALSWTLLEPRRRRRLFLEEAARELRLSNVRILEERFGGEATGAERTAISMRGVRLSHAELDRATRALSEGGRFLWLSGEERLREGAACLESRPGLRIEGPVRLLPGSEARLLVVIRVAGTPSAGCFT
jgi:16S rRNA (guanine527-N7)-methyltransferase